MATFPSINPIYGVLKRSSPVKKVISFADGYEHRVTFGLAEHKNPKIYTLIFEVSETDSDTIETFLDARANNNESFDFTAPGESSSQKFVCDSWTKTITYLNRARINTTFREVFEP